MGGQPSTTICPKCGAAMIAYGFSYVCEYCGYLDGCGNMELTSPSIKDVKARFEYLEHNAQYLEKRRSYIGIEGKYTIVSKSPFSPKVNYSAIRTILLGLFYQNNGEEEDLRIYLQVEILESTPYIIFRLSGGEKLVLNFSYGDSKGMYATISIQTLKAISTSNFLSYATNCFPLGYDFSEFTTYCARFYNIVFNRNQLLFSFLLTNN